MFHDIRQALGPVFHESARRQAGMLVDGHRLPDQVQLCLERPPPSAVSARIGLVQGRSALAMARQFKGRQRHCNGETFWAQGYAVSTVGLERETVRRYIREQEAADPSGPF